MLTKKYKLFGNEAVFFADADELMAEPVMADAYQLAMRLQKIFNLYDETSEISLLNRQRRIKASPELLEVLKSALNMCELAKGEYDVSLGKQFLQRKKRQPLPKLSCSYKDIIINGSDVSLQNQDAWLDLGSVAKGYIAERLAGFLAEQGIESGYVDARGDIKVFGDARIVGIQHPRNNSLLHTITVKDKGIATSGDYKQFDKDHSKSHIINQKEIISATVVSDSLMVADAYATILMVCSNELREPLINESRFPAMVVDKELNIKYFNGFEELIAHES
jgi:FAD:protein FMN transferase